MMKKKLPPHLGEREHQAARLFAEGKSYAEIAAEMRISTNTAASYLKTARSLLKAHSRTALQDALSNLPKGGADPKLLIKTLTELEVELLSLFGAGSADAEMGKRYQLSARQIRFRFTQICHKLRVQTRHEALQFYRDHLT